MRDAIKIIGQLGQIAWSYRNKKVENTYDSKRKESYFLTPTLNKA